MTTHQKQQAVAPWIAEWMARKGYTMADVDPHAAAAKEVAELKAKYSIWTHYAEGCEWLALCPDQCHAALDGYPLTDGEKADPVLLLAGYCRLLDEAGLTADGCQTELEAVRKIVKKLEEEE